MIRFFIASSVAFITFSTTTLAYSSTIDGYYISKAEKFEVEGLYDMSFNQLLTCTTDEESLACLNRLVLFVDNQFKMLPKWKNNTLTVFTPKEISMKDYWTGITALFASTGIGGAVGGAGSLAAAVGEASMMVVGPAIMAPFVYIWTRDGIQVSKEEAEKIAVEEIKKSNEYLLKCNTLQKYIAQSLLVFEKKIQSNDYDKELVDAYKYFLQLKENLIAHRINYVSYTLVSPCLAATSQQIYIANKKTWLWGADEDTLREAAKIMASAATEQLLRESNQDVRAQFLNVYRNFKDISGKALMEEFKVIQTLSDKINDNKLGSSAWWQ